ncbi:MAG: hypothetical protein ABI579_10125, partial [Candidatus Sumerlaeota bacterium]
MSGQVDIAKLIGALDDLWREGEHEEAIAGALRLTQAYPESAAAFEKLALFRIHHAASDPPDDQLSPALDALNKALELEPENLDAREIRANLFFLLAHHFNDPSFFQRSLRDFLELERIGLDEAEERLAHWRLEAARSAFLAARNAPGETADYALAAARKVGIAPDPLILNGGVFKHNSTVLIDVILDRIRPFAPNVNPIMSRHEPAVGALMLAFEQHG